MCQKEEDETGFEDNISHYQHDNGNKKTSLLSVMV